MTNVIGVRYKPGGKIYYFDPQDMVFQEGENVIVDTSRGVEFGICAEGNHEVPDSAVVQPLHNVLRKATEEDEKNHAELKKKENRAFDICEEKIRQHGLDMKLVDVEYNFEGSKILFFFTSDGRVDFRELVKDLAGVFRTRIELRQIGVRDEAKLLGGLGICGRPFCCASFLGDFQPVSIKMAKVQNLSLNPTKISGTCGRLMCCLKYEQEAYEDATKKLPRVNTPIDTPAGKGTICDVNLLRETVTVKYENTVDKKTYKYSSLVDGTGEEYIPGSSKPKLHLSESLLGIGFTAEEAFSQMERAGVSVSDVAPENTAKPRQDEQRTEGGTNHKRRHRGGRGRGGKSQGDQRPDARSGEQRSQSKQPKTPKATQEHQGEAKPGDSAQRSGSRRRRGGRGRGGRPQGEQRPDIKPGEQLQGGQTDRAPKRPEVKPTGDGGQKKSNGEQSGGSHSRSRNKYRGRAGNRPKTDGTPSSPVNE